MRISAASIISSFRFKGASIAALSSGIMVERFWRFSCGRAIRSANLQPARKGVVSNFARSGLISCALMGNSSQNVMRRWVASFFSIHQS